MRCALNLIKWSQMRSNSIQTDTWLWCLQSLLAHFYSPRVPTTYLRLHDVCKVFHKVSRGKALSSFHQFSFSKYQVFINYISYQPEKHSIFCSKHFQRFLQGFCKYPATHKVIKYDSVKCKPKRESFANVVQLCSCHTYVAGSYYRSKQHVQQPSYRTGK